MNNITQVFSIFSLLSRKMLILIQKIIIPNAHKKLIRNDNIYPLNLRTFNLYNEFYYSLIYLIYVMR